MTLAQQDVKCQVKIFMCLLCSGQSLVIGPTVVEFEVWLHSFASTAAASALPAPQKAHSHLPAL